MEKSTDKYHKLGVMQSIPDRNDASKQNVFPKTKRKSPFLLVWIIVFCSVISIISPFSWRFATHRLFSHAAHYFVCIWSRMTEQFIWWRLVMEREVPITHGACSYVYIYGERVGVICLLNNVSLCENLSAWHHSVYFWWLRWWYIFSHLDIIYCS